MRFCPECKARIEKAEGCNHMTCYYCEFQFCWICGGTYTSDHFAMFNPLGCGGLQFDNYDRTSVISYIWLLVKRILSLVVLVILAPLALIFGPPIAAAALAVDSTSRCFGRWNDQTCCERILTLLIGLLFFGIGVASLAIIVPLGVVVGLPAVIIYQIVERYKKKQVARERLRQRM